MIAKTEILDMGNHKDEQVKVLDAKKISEFKKIISISPEGSGINF